MPKVVNTLRVEFDKDEVRDLLLEAAKEQARVTVGMSWDAELGGTNGMPETTVMLELVPVPFENKKKPRKKGGRK